MAAVNAVLSALAHPAAQHIDSFEVCDQLYVDFTGASHSQSGSADSTYNLASADWFMAFKLPVGALVTEVGWVTHTTDGNNPTFAITLEDDGSGTTTLKSATAIGAQYVSVQTKTTAAEIVTVSNGTTSGVIKILGGTATNDAGIVTFYVKYLIVKRQAA